MSTTPSFPVTYDCGIRLPRQNKSEDCWADCVAGVLAFLDVPNPPTQDDVRRSWLKGDLDRPLPWPDVATVFEAFGATGVGPDAPLGADVLREEMAARRPVMVGYEWARGGGHVALVTGYREWTGRFLVQDPFFGPGELSYYEIVRGYGVGRWVVSWGRFARKEKST